MENKMTGQIHRCHCKVAIAGVRVDQRSAGKYLTIEFHFFGITLSVCIPTLDSIMLLLSP